MVSLIHDKFRTELITGPFFEFFQNIRTYAGAVAEPFHVLFPFLLIKGKGKLMKKCSKAHHIDIRIVFAPLFHLFLDVFLRLRLSYVISKLMGGIFPVICNKIVHMYRIPYEERQKAHRILMVFYAFYLHFLRLSIIFPLIRRHHFSGCPVYDLPPSLRVINSIYFQLLRMEPFHQLNAQPGIPGRYSFADQIFLLYFIGIRICPLIIFSGGIISSIFLPILRQKFFRHRRSVAIPQGIRPEKIFQTYCLIHHIYIGRQCQPSCHTHILLLTVHPVPAMSGIYFVYCLL